LEKYPLQFQEGCEQGIENPTLKQNSNTHPVKGIFTDKSYQAMPVHRSRGDGRV